MDDIFIVSTLLWYSNNSKESQTVSNNVTSIVLGSFAKLWKANTRFVTYVRLSAWNNSAPIGSIFMKFNIWVFFENKSNPITGLDRPWGFQEAEAPRFQDNRHMKVVRLSTLRTGCLYPQETFLVLISIFRKYFE